MSNQEQKPQERRYSLEEIDHMIGYYLAQYNPKHIGAAAYETSELMEWLREQEATGKVDALAIPKNPLSEIIGKWPGDETDEEFNEMLKDNK